jgi:uncharacterized protein
MAREPLSELSDEERRIALEMAGQLGRSDFLFAVVTGTHQYGFTSPDSDIDVRGVYASPTAEHLGLGRKVQRHAEYSGQVLGRDADCLAFELGRFAELLLKHAGNVLEELFSPLVLFDKGRLADFRRVIGGCLTQGLSRHYVGFFEACIKKLRTREPREVKTALYACRIALTGIEVLTEGHVEAHLPTLAEKYGLDWVPEWISLKTTEHIAIPEGRFDEMMARLAELRRELHRASARSPLPHRPARLDELDALLIEVRLERLAGPAHEPAHEPGEAADEAEREDSAAE